MQFVRRFDGLSAVPRLGNAFEIGMLVDQCSEAVAQNLVIIRDHHSFGSSGFLFCSVHDRHHSVIFPQAGGSHSYVLSFDTRSGEKPYYFLIPASNYLSWQWSLVRVEALVI